MIPHVDLQTEKTSQRTRATDETSMLASFDIRPLRRTVDPAVLQEGPHRHNFQELLWVKSGVGQHKIDDKELMLEPHTFYLIAQGQVHYFDKGIELDGYLIRFTDDFLWQQSDQPSWDYRMTLFSHFAVHRSLTIGEDDLPQFQLLMDWLWREQGADRFGRTLVLRQLLSTLLIQLERARQSTEQQRADRSEQDQLYLDFINQLEESYALEHGVEFYAASLFVTPRQLSDVVRKYTGKTAKQLIRERVILEARRHLHHTNSSVKEIAYSLGFADPSYFSKAFKQVAGFAPHEYKADVISAKM